MAKSAQVGLRMKKKPEQEINDRVNNFNLIRTKINT